VFIVIGIANLARGQFFFLLDFTRKIMLVKKQLDLPVALEFVNWCAIMLSSSWLCQSFLSLAFVRFDVILV